MMEKFSLEYYKLMLLDAKKNHEFVFADEIESVDKPSIFLRHDVDLSLHSAQTMAQLEHSIGICSTYYLRLNGSYYNIFSNEGYAIVREILTLGHQIGLHFDTGFYDEMGIDFEEGIKRDRQLIEICFNTTIHSVSQHRPFSLGQAEGHLFERLGLLFTYQKNLMNKFKYISDSGQRWREGDLSQHLDKSYLQVLVHPIWWTPGGEPWQEIMNNNLTRIQRGLSEKNNLLINRYGDYLEKREQPNIV